MRHPEPGARVTDEVAGREVVGAVEDEVVVGDDRQRRVGREALAVLDHGRHRADRVDRVGGRGRLGPADVGVAVDHLALEVRRLDDVVVDDAERPHPGRGEVEQRGRPEAAGADDEDPGRAQPSLADAAEVGQEEVARVARALGRVELGTGRHERGSGHAATITTA